MFASVQGGSFPHSLFASGKGSLCRMRDLECHGLAWLLRIKAGLSCISGPNKEGKKER